MTLVVATIFTNAGFSTLAASMQNVIYRNAISSQEKEKAKVSRYYEQYLEERQMLLMGNDSSIALDRTNGDKNTSQTSGDSGANKNINENNPSINKNR